MSTPYRHLWLLPDSAVEAFIARMGGTALLTDAERQSCERRLTPERRLRRLATRLLARHALSAHSGHPPASWRFCRTSYGRPEPEPADHELRFNLTHTDGLIACVVTDGDRACGVDAERAPAGADAVAYLPRFFAERERAELAAVADGVRADRVAAYWVLKEAYLKALGTGLRRELSAIAFSGVPGGPVHVHDPEHPTGHWQFDLIRPNPGHVVAVATEHAGPGGLGTTTLSG